MIRADQADGGQESTAAVSSMQSVDCMQIRKDNDYVNAMLGGGPAHISPSDPSAPENKDLKNFDDHLHFSGTE